MTDARRAPGEGQVYSRMRNGHTEFVARLPLDEWAANKDGNLRRRYWSKVFRAASETPRGLERTKDAAKRALDDEIAEREAGSIGNPERVTVANVLDRYLAHCESMGLKPSTLAGYESAARFWRERIGGMRIVQLRAGHVQTAMDQAKRSRNTIRNYRALLRQALNYARVLDLVTANAAKDVILPKAPKRKPKPYDREQVAQLIAYLTPATDETLPYLFTVLTGWRQAEVVGLQWSALAIDDIEDASATVARTVYRKRREWHEVAPKSDESRRETSFIPLLASELRAHRVRQMEARLRAGPMWDDRGLVFCNEAGGPLHASTLLRRWARIAREAGLPVKTFHELRHSHATSLLTMGIPLTTIQSRLGHSDSRTTQIYAEVVKDLEREAGAAMGALLKREAQ